MVRPYTARASPLRLVRSVPPRGRAITRDPTIYKVRYVQFDAAGNPIRGNLNETTTCSPAAQSIDVTVANVLASTGFNTNCAVVNGVVRRDGDHGRRLPHDEGGATRRTSLTVHPCYVTRTVTQPVVRRLRSRRRCKRQTMRLSQTILDRYL